MCLHGAFLSTRWLSRGTEGVMNVMRYDGCDEERPKDFGASRDWVRLEHARRRFPGTLDLCGSCADGVVAMDKLEALIPADEANV